MCIVIISLPQILKLTLALLSAEAVVQRCSVKKVFLEISQSHRKTPVPETLFNKFAGLRPATLLKKSLWHRCFPVNFAKFLRTPFFTEHLRWLLLYQAIFQYDQKKQDKNVNIFRTKRAFKVK